MLQSFFQTLHDSTLGSAVREGSSLFPWIESIHVLALTTVVGSIAIVDLRLLGVASRARSITKVMNDILPITWIAFAVALVTGFILFISKAPQYAANIFFQIKMSLLLLIGINVLAFHSLIARTAAKWDASASVPTSARMAGGISLLLWTGVVVVGRWIGFAS